MAAQPAARVGDYHRCPMFEGSTPHVGGVIMAPGQQQHTFVEGQPAACVGDACVCTGPADSVVKGSASVFIGGKPAARINDPTAHGGMIAAGAARTYIGDGEGAPNKMEECLKGAARDGAATVS